VTDDKDFKHLVREEALRSGRHYAEVQAELRPPAEPGVGAGPMSPAEVARRVEAIEGVARRWLYDKPEALHLVALALLVPGSVLFSGISGTGITAMGKGVAAAIGGRLVAIDGRTGFDAAEAMEWRAGDVVLISHFDGLDPASQVAVIEAGRRPAIVLAKRHLIADRMPHPPDDDTRERFLFGAEFGYVDADTELRIVDEIRARIDGGPIEPAIEPSELVGMREAAAAVEVPAEVRRFAVEAMAAVRGDEQVMLGGSTVATINLVQAICAAAVADGRGRATIDDARWMLPPILAHRIVFRSDARADLPALLDRVLAARPMS